MQQNVTSSPTIIDILSDGFRAINRKPLLLILPLLLNLYLWFGPPISIAPLTNELVDMVSRLQPATTTSNDLSMLELLGSTDMRVPLARLNAIPVIPLDRPLAADGAGSIQIGSVALVLLAFVLLNSVALPLSAVFLTWMGSALQPTRESVLRQVGRVLVAMLAVAALLAGVGIALLLPFTVFLMIMMAISPAIGFFVVTLLSLVIFWVQIYLGFTNEAIVLGHMGPIRALQSSFQIVRRFFWGTLGLLILSGVISAGFAVVWQILMTNQLGLAASLIASAYLGTGLQAARMIFFQDRLQRWSARPQPSLKGTR